MQLAAGAASSNILTIFTDIMLWTCALEQIAHGLQLIGVANNNTVFVTLVGLANYSEASLLPISTDSSYL